MEEQNCRIGVCSWHQNFTPDLKVMITLVKGDLPANPVPAVVVDVVD